MHEINTEKFGAFLAQLRKEKGLTQREVAEKLYLSDKAVSKWERGVSLPDIALLTPLAELMGVTVAELLAGERVQHMEMDEVERLVAGTIALSVQERNRRSRSRRFWRRAYALSLAAVAVELGALMLAGLTPAALVAELSLVEGLTLLFGGWFCLLAKDTLPAYYDENAISFYAQGVFRMNLPGVRFHNGNWPYILRAGRVWMLSAAVIYPAVVGLGMTVLSPAGWERVRVWAQLTASLGFFVPMMAAARKYK